MVSVEEINSGIYTDKAHRMRNLDIYEVLSVESPSQRQV